MAQLHPPGRSPQLPHRRRIALPRRGNGQAPRNPRIALPGMQPQQANKQPHRIAQKCQHRKCQDQKGQAGGKIHQRQHHLLHQPTKLRRQKPQARAQRRTNEGGAKGHKQTHPNGGNKPRQHIAAQFIRAQWMQPVTTKPNGRREPVAQVKLGDAKGHDHIRQRRHRQHQPHPAQRQHDQHRQAPARENNTRHQRDLSRGSSTP